MKIFDLYPIDGRSDFYGKAKVVEDAGFAFLKSYDTIVACIHNGKLHRFWPGSSATTSRHLRSFCNHYSIVCPTVKEWKAMEIENFPENQWDNLNIPDSFWKRRESTYYSYY